MPITRTPIVDDSGSGQDGTVIDNAWKQELYNQIDAFAGKAGPPYKLGSSLSYSFSFAALNDFYPPNGNTAVVWGLAPGQACNITGIAAEADLTMHLLVNTAGFNLVFFNQHANSLPANRLVGPGFANYTLAPWRAVWIVYMAAYTSWLVLSE